jgi:signal peptide peptidase SppA
MRLIDIVTAPWALQPEKLREIRDIYATHLRGEKIDIAALEARVGQPLANNQTRDYEVVDGVAIISVDGVIAPKANLFMQISGGASAQIIERQVREAAADPYVRSILLDIDSPGGSVQGVPEVAAAVRAAAEAKPVVAWTAGTMASGAYWIASAADRVYISNGTAVVGSIGVVGTHVDISRAEQSRGVKTTEITAGKYKRIASSYEPLSAEGRDTLQAQVDAIYEVFVDAVADGRGVDVQTVLSEMADGRIFIGRQAVQAGLADGVLSRDALLEQLASGEYGKRRAAHQVTAGAPVPSSTTEPKGVHMEPSKPITVDVIKAEHPAVADALIAQGRQEGAQAERERIRGVEAAALRGFESIVDVAKWDGTSSGDQVAGRIVAAQKADQAAALKSLHEQAPAPVAAAAAPNPASLPAAKPSADAHNLAQRATAYQTEQARAGRRVSIGEAVAHVSKEQ